MGTLTVQNLQGPTSGANANKVIIPSGQTLDASNGLTTPSGHIIQSLTQEVTAISTTTSTSLVATAFTLTITPKFTSSKIKCTLGLSGVHANTVQSAVELSLYKDGSHLKYLHSLIGYSSGATQDNMDATIMATDSPSTTSAVTYAIYWRRGYGSGTVYYNNYINANRTRSWFTVEEIAQ